MVWTLPHGLAVLVTALVPITSHLTAEAWGDISGSHHLSPGWFPGLPDPIPNFLSTVPPADRSHSGITQRKVMLQGPFSQGQTQHGVSTPHSSLLADKCTQRPPPSPPTQAGMGGRQQVATPPLEPDQFTSDPKRSRICSRSHNHTAKKDQINPNKSIRALPPGSWVTLSPPLCEIPVLHQSGLTKCSGPNSAAKNRNLLSRATNLRAAGESPCWVAAGTGALHFPLLPLDAQPHGHPRWDECPFTVRPGITWLRGDGTDHAPAARRGRHGRG